MLFSYMIMFRCPVSGKEIKITKEPDREIMDFFDSLGWAEAASKTFRETDKYQS